MSFSGEGSWEGPLGQGQLLPTEGLEGHGGNLHGGRSRKRTKQGIYTSDITVEDLARHFHQPASKACQELGMGLTIFKRVCRKLGLQRWPYEKPCRGDSAGPSQQRPSGAPPPLGTNGGMGYVGAQHTQPWHLQGGNQVTATSPQMAAALAAAGYQSQQPQQPQQPQQTYWDQAAAPVMQQGPSVWHSLPSSHAAQQQQQQQQHSNWQQLPVSITQQQSQLSGSAGTGSGGGWRAAGQPRISSPHQDANAPHAATALAGGGLTAAGAVQGERAAGSTPGLGEELLAAAAQVEAALSQQGPDRASIKSAAIRRLAEVLVRDADSAQELLAAIGQAINRHQHSGRQQRQEPAPQQEAVPPPQSWRALQGPEPRQQQQQQPVHYTTSQPMAVLQQQCHLPAMRLVQPPPPLTTAAAEHQRSHSPAKPQAQQSAPRVHPPQEPPQQQYRQEDGGDQVAAVINALQWVMQQHPDDQAQLQQERQSQHAPHQRSLPFFQQQQRQQQQQQPTTAGVSAPVQQAAAPAAQTSMGQKPDGSESLVPPLLLRLLNWKQQVEGTHREEQGPSPAASSEQAAANLHGDGSIEQQQQQQEHECIAEQQASGDGNPGQSKRVYCSTAAVVEDMQEQQPQMLEQQQQQQQKELQRSQLPSQQMQQQAAAAPAENGVVHSMQTARLNAEPALPTEATVEWSRRVVPPMCFATVAADVPPHRSEQCLQGTSSTPQLPGVQQAVTLQQQRRHPLAQKLAGINEQQALAGVLMAGALPPSALALLAAALQQAGDVLEAADDGDDGSGSKFDKASVPEELGPQFQARQCLKVDQPSQQHEPADMSHSE